MEEEVARAVQVPVVAEVGDGAAAAQAMGAWMAAAEEEARAVARWMVAAAEETRRSVETGCRW